MKITIYELLRLIKDNKYPKKIKYCGHIYEWEDYWYLTKTKNGKVCLGGVQDEINQLFHAFDENVEIIEEEKDIEFLGKQDLYIDDAKGYSVNIEKIGDKINELVREVKKLKRKNEK